MKRHNPYGAYPKYPFEEQQPKPSACPPDHDFVDKEWIRRERENSGGLSDSPDPPPKATPSKPTTI